MRSIKLLGRISYKKKKMTTNPEAKSARRSNPPISK